jgi:hypothetical protein
MLESTGDRIKRILSLHEQHERTETARKLALETQKIAARDFEHKIAEKWAADTRVISAILADFATRLSHAGMLMTFQTESAPAGAAAEGRIHGRISGNDVHATIQINPDGDVHLSREGPTRKDAVVNFAASSGSVFQADREFYERLILDLIESYIGNTNGPSHIQAEIDAA